MYLPTCRVAVRPNDGAHYVINMGGRLDPRLIALVPDFCNVRVRYVDNSTLHSDTCTFQRTLSEIGEAPCTHAHMKSRRCQHQGHARRTMAAAGPVLLEAVTELRCSTPCYL